MSMEKQRFVWIDCMKLFACILVVVGHQYMSMVECGWISGDASYYCLPIQTIYSFHVPLFFVCSGFLYQAKPGDYTINEHFKNIQKKALNLGIPYVTFSLITLILKKIFASSVNNQAGSILKTLIIEPTAPYWFLYALFFIFCVIPKQKSKENLKKLFVITLIIKIIYISFLRKFGLPDIISKVAGNAIWFAFGMLLSNEELAGKIMKKYVALFSGVIGMALAILLYRQNFESAVFQFLLGSLFVYTLCYIFKEENYRTRDWITDLSKYYLPVYLMHTIVAAGIRTILIKAGIVTVSIHFGVELIAGIGIPIIIYNIACKHWYLLFWIEPTKALKQLNLKRKGSKD